MLNATIKAGKKRDELSNFRDVLPLKSVDYVMNQGFSEREDQQSKCGGDNLISQ